MIDVEGIFPGRFGHLDPVAEEWLRSHSRGDAPGRDTIEFVGGPLGREAELSMECWKLATMFEFQPPKSPGEIFNCLLEIGRLLLDSQPYRTKAVQALDKCLGDQGFADQLYAAIAMQVLDLPASEKHHHPYPGGLLDHSIETSLGTILELRRGRKQHRGKARGPWDIAGMITAGVHDLGKVFDVEIKAPNGDIWRPEDEELFFFKTLRRKCPFTRLPIAYRAGRGLITHETRWSLSKGLLPPPGHPANPNNEVAQALDSYIRRYAGNDDSDLPEMALRIAAAVSAADSKSTAYAMRKGSRPGAYLEELIRAVR